MSEQLHSHSLLEAEENYLQEDGNDEADDSIYNSKILFQHRKGIQQNSK